MTTGSHEQSAVASSGIKAQDEWTPGKPVEPLEQTLLDRTEAGKGLELVGDGRVDRQAMDEWGPARTVRAAVLRHLLVEPEWPVHSRGVWLRGARITGRLDLESATVRCPVLLEDCYLDSPDPLPLDYVTAPRIVLSRCRVVGGLTASLLGAKGLDLRGSAFEGVVRLLDADITGPLFCGGAQLTGTDGDGAALVGDRMKVGGGVFLDQGFTAAGAVSITGARIGGSMWLNEAEFAEPVALNAGGIHVGGELRWAPRSPVRGRVDLERAAVHRLDDDWSLPDAHWPPAGQLRLAGFTYEGFGGYHRASWRQRLDWIRRSHTTATGTAPAVFAGQPYEQLARIYRQIGHESQARQVAIARRNDVRRYGSLTRARKFGNWLLDKTIRHGYQPLRAVGLLVAVYAAVLLVFWGAQHQDDVIVPAKTITPVPTALHCSPAYPCFYPAAYAIDVVVPIINLRQAQNWRPNGHAPWGWVYLAVGWAATGLGWAFTTLAVAGYTGLVRKE